MRAKKEGFPVALYLDSRTNTYVEEFSTSNFFGIDKNGAYVTPKSQAILGSVTNKSLMDLARSEGINVIQRQVPIEEVSTFKEVAACGTAVVVTPVKSITYQNKVWTFLFSC
jgi:branched-chain amino acid aminotransferase